MAFTYDASTDAGRVRLLLGDTSTPGHQFEDDEIAAFLDLAEGDVFFAAAYGYRALAALASKAGGAHGVIEIKYGPRTDKFTADQLLAMAEDMEKRSRGVPWEEIDSFDYTVDPWGRDHSEYVGERYTEFT